MERDGDEFHSPAKALPTATRPLEKEASIISREESQETERRRGFSAGELLEKKRQKTEKSGRKGVGIFR